MMDSIPFQFAPGIQPTAEDKKNTEISDKQHPQQEQSTDQNMDMAKGNNHEQTPSANPTQKSEGPSNTHGKDMVLPEGMKKRVGFIHRQQSQKVLEEELDPINTTVRRSSLATVINHQAIHQEGNACMP